MVMGPTPPGTGVIWLTLSLTFSKSTSPSNFHPDFVRLEGTLVIPTSMIQAPSFIISEVTKLAFPKATISMSAFLQISFMFFDLL